MHQEARAIFLRRSFAPCRNRAPGICATLRRLASRRRVTAQLVKLHLEQKRLPAQPYFLKRLLKPTPHLPRLRRLRGSGLLGLLLKTRHKRAFLKSRCKRAFFNRRCRCWKRSVYSLPFERPGAEHYGFTRRGFRRN